MRIPLDVIQTKKSVPQTVSLPDEATKILSDLLLLPLPAFL